ncbi:MAG TPA: pyridoxamine 5'-phosphate oxidase family protein [Gemmatimonadaceae bacterium]|nr:pyridoxamine 5'-phosphate oxidase family protein [Gemmatimonadaceae bacterium]
MTPGASATPGSGPRILSEAECRAVLAEVGWGVLATNGQAGTPYGVPVGYALGRDCLYLASADGLKRRNVEADGRVCLTVADVRSFDEWRSVVVRGDATRVEGLAEHAVAIAAFTAQRAPRVRPMAADLERLLGARLFRLPLDAMTGRARGLG